MSGLKFVNVDCGQSIVENRSPASQFRSPDVIETGSVREAAMIANRDLAHAPQDQQLDLGDFGHVDERSLHARILRPVRAHGMGTRSMMSLITRSVVRP